eukprot:COSAG03_NODE_8709_length_777_cov_1.957227_2_plen_77_part_00
MREKESVRGREAGRQGGKGARADTNITHTRARAQRQTDRRRDRETMRGTDLGPPLRCTLPGVATAPSCHHHGIRSI